MLMETGVLLYDPAVFCVGWDYQIIFLTRTRGMGWVEIAGERFTTEEGGLLLYDTVHKISVPGELLDRAGKYTVVFVEYADLKPYFPKGVEKLRKEYAFYPANGETLRIFQFADTHARVETPLELYRQVGDCDLVVLNGDINEHSYTIENFYTSFALLAGATHGERPAVYSRGNHDTRGRAARYLLDHAPTATRDGRRETCYSFRQGALWGVVLDCGEDKWDDHPEYGGAVRFHDFRWRQASYLRELIAKRTQEYAAPGVKHRIAVCHIPFVEYFEEPFGIEDAVYDEWVALLNEIGIDLLLCGHIHRAYFIPGGVEGCRRTEFPTMVASIPAVKREDGSEYYVGGLLELSAENRRAVIVPTGQTLEF